MKEKKKIYNSDNEEFKMSVLTVFRMFTQNNVHCLVLFFFQISQLYPILPSGLYSSSYFT